LEIRTAPVEETNKWKAGEQHLNLKILIETLTKEIQEDVNILSARSKFYKISQKEKESVREYYDRLKSEAKIVTLLSLSGKWSGIDLCWELIW
jgi:hypothetical protein